jgi:hypothetical protein
VRVFQNRVMRRIFGPKMDDVRGEEGVKVLVRKPEGKRPLRRSRRRWEVEIRMDLREIGWGVWIGFC